MCGRLTMKDAVQLLGIDCDYTRPQVNITCPSCETKKKLNIDFGFHSGDGVFRCPKCNFQGGPLDFWAYFRNLDSSNKKEVAKDFHAYVEGKNPTGKPVSTRKVAAKERVDVDSAGIDTRSRTYTALLDALILSEEHKCKLMQRGLSEDAITRLGYKSYPAAEKEAYCQILLSSGYVLKGVPGFFQKEDGTWTMMSAGKGGFLIPQRDGLGRIQGMQIRSDDPSCGKYLTLSSADRRNGSKGKAYCHFVRGTKDCSDVILTEGPLKGDIISYYTGYSVLAVQGVNSIKAMKRAIIDLYTAGSLSKLSLAYDMDLYENPYVQRALLNLKSMLTEFEIPFSQIDWCKDYERYGLKGLDDWLRSRKNL